VGAVHPFPVWAVHPFPVWAVRPPLPVRGIAFGPAPRRAGTPGPIIGPLNAELAKSLATFEAHERLPQQGACAVDTEPDRAAARLRHGLRYAATRRSSPVYGALLTRRSGPL
jgi:hypothetical protein